MKMMYDVLLKITKFSIDNNLLPREATSGVN